MSAIPKLGPHRPQSSPARGVEGGVANAESAAYGEQNSVSVLYGTGALELPREAFAPAREHEWDAQAAACVGCGTAAKGGAHASTCAYCDALLEGQHRD